MSRYKPELFRYLREYFDGMSSLGIKPILVLDTSSIIQLEQAFRRKQGYARAFQFIDHLTATAPEQDAFIVVPAGVKDEVTQHHLYHSVNRRPEISKETVDRLILSPTQLQSVSSYLQTEQGASRTDTFRYELRGHYLENMTGKKASADPISLTDWEVIDTALASTAYSASHFRQNSAVGSPHPLWGCYRVAVLTGDKHISWTLGEAFNIPRGTSLADYVRPINTRGFIVE
ncbi:hypothetical protein J4210_02170 [Candidatus Woesearchaeota archaeon]|nr:hypothetical protein [Candidatus Woesearchaeota archaeon]